MTAALARSGAAPTRWIAVAVVVASGVVAALQVGKGAIALPALRAEFGLGLEAAGWIMSVFALLGVAGGIPAGAAVARFGDRRLLALGLAALALGSVVGSTAGSFPLLLGTRVLEGLGFLLVVVAAPALLQRIAAAEDRDLTFGIWSAFMPAGMAIALLLGASLAGWRPFWLANAILAGAFVLLLLLFVRAQARSNDALSWREIGRDAVLTATSRGPLLLASAFVLYSLLYFALASFLPVLLMDRMGVAVGAAGALSAVAVGANVLGNLAAGMLLGRGAARWGLIATAAVVMTLTGIAVFAVPLPPMVVFLLCVVFSGVGGLLPATVLGAAALVAPKPHLGPMTLGLTMQGSNLGQVIGPVAVGGVVDAAGWPAAAIPVAVAGVLALAVAALLRGVFSAE